ncbi:MAG: N-acetylmuramoyl-L-alanine amidase [Lachnospiraceae bacterium]|nr:N-acetylmuramoyl-L-alanine amidase [Lachnospiraceae bacterium]
MSKKKKKKKQYPLLLAILLLLVLSLAGSMAFYLIKNIRAQEAARQAAEKAASESIEAERSAEAARLAEEEAAREAERAERNSQGSGAEEESSEEEAAPTETPTPTPTPTPEPTPTETPKNGHMVAIDAGHQAHGNSEQEPIGPGARETKAKVASGTHGRTSGLYEYELNLQVALKLKEELLKRGYDVYMVRETHDVDIANSERAILSAEAGADILVRIHANGSDDTSYHGALCYQPSLYNPFLASEVITESQRLSQMLLDYYVAATGARNLGLLTGDDMTGINWSTIPVTIVEMGFMTNPDEDLLMASDEYQEKIVEGLANGIDAYFGVGAPEV